MSLQLDVITSNAITFANHSDPLFQNDGRRGAATEFAVYQNIYRLYLIVVTAAAVSCQDLDLLDLVSSWELWAPPSWSILFCMWASTWTRVGPVSFLLHVLNNRNWVACFHWPTFIITIIICRTLNGIKKLDLFIIILLSSHKSEY